MFRPSIQKTRILVFLALINIIVYYFVSSSVVTFRASDYELKIASAEKMENALNVLKKYGRKYPFLSRDPFDTRLVFLNTETSPLLTDIGKYEAKSTVLKPNFSALIIDQFSKSGLNKGDTIDISDEKYQCLASLEALNKKPLLAFLESKFETFEPVNETGCSNLLTMHSELLPILIVNSIPVVGNVRFPGIYPIGAGVNGRNIFNLAGGFLYETLTSDTSFEVGTKYDGFKNAPFPSSVK